MLKNEIAGRKVSIVLIIILTVVLVALVIWVFDKRIHRIENRLEGTSRL